MAQCGRLRRRSSSSQVSGGGADVGCRATTASSDHAPNENYGKLPILWAVVSLSPCARDPLDRALCTPKNRAMGDSIRLGACDVTADQASPATAPRSWPLWSD